MKDGSLMNASLPVGDDVDALHSQNLKATEVPLAEGVRHAEGLAIRLVEHWEPPEPLYTGSSFDVPPPSVTSIAPQSEIDVKSIDSGTMLQASNISADHYIGGDQTTESTMGTTDPKSVGNFDTLKSAEQREIDRKVGEPLAANTFLVIEGTVGPEQVSDGAGQRQILEGTDAIPVEHEIPASEQAAVEALPVSEQNGTGYVEAYMEIQPPVVAITGNSDTYIGESQPAKSQNIAMSPLMQSTLMTDVDADVSRMSALLQGASQIILAAQDAESNASKQFGQHAASSEAPIAVRKVKPETDNAASLRSFGQPIRMYSVEEGAALFSRVHNADRRRATLTPEERIRYPLLTDPTLHKMIDVSASEKQQSEIDRLSSMINESDVPIPAYLRRRGVVHAQMANYQRALEDLEMVLEYGELIWRSILLELIIQTAMVDPYNLDACWFRHQLNLLRGNIQGALQDLDTITEIDRKHFGAFQAKAYIYQELGRLESVYSLRHDISQTSASTGMVKLAIVNYSQLIKLKPAQADGYYQRACLFEAENVRPDSHQYWTS